MKYQKIINLLENTANQPSTFRTKKWVKINDDTRGKYNTNSQIKFKTSMLRSILCDYSDVYVLVKGTMTAEITGISAALNNRNKKIIFKNCSLFTGCINEINTKEIDHAKNIDVVMPMYNLIEYSDNYSKTPGSSWQYYGGEPFIDNNGNIIDVRDDPDSTSFKYKQKITGETGNDGTKDVQIMVPLKYLSNFWRTLEMPLINCEMNTYLTWSENCIIVTRDHGVWVAKFEINHAKLYVSVVTLSAQDNEKL